MKDFLHTYEEDDCPWWADGSAAGEDAKMWLESHPDEPVTEASIAEMLRIDLFEAPAEHVSYVEEVARIVQILMEERAA